MFRWVSPIAANSLEERITTHSVRMNAKDKAGRLFFPSLAIRAAEISTDNTDAINNKIQKPVLNS